jgi:hypothetical protein
MENEAMYLLFCSLLSLVSPAMATLFPIYLHTPLRPDLVLDSIFCSPVKQPTWILLMNLAKLSICYMTNPPKPQQGRRTN